MGSSSREQVAVITGAASGIGQALAVAYAKCGVRVVGGFYPGDAHDPNATRSAIETFGGRCVMLPVDVSDTRSVDGFLAEAVERFGRVDAVVANAGLLRASALEDLTDARWSELLEVDLTGVFRTLRAGARHLQNGGALVAVSSAAGPIYGWQNHAHYAAAKSGVQGLCRSLAIELAPRGIRCNVVIPGLIETPQTLDEVNSLGVEGLANAAAAAIPLGRVGRASEVADLILFLTSERASYITGQDFIIDGGMAVKSATL